MNWWINMQNVYLIVFGIMVFLTLWIVLDNTPFKNPPKWMKKLRLVEKVRADND